VRYVEHIYIDIIVFIPVSAAKDVLTPKKNWMPILKQLRRANQG